MLIAVAAAVALERPAQWPVDVQMALEAAGDNRAELEQVLEHYVAQDDTLKLQAAYFLVSNMPGHGYVQYDLVDSAGGVINFDVTAYADYAELLASFDTMEDDHGTLDFEKRELIEDVRVITADFLINQIDMAFRAWRERPWADQLPWPVFREFVLPYRGSNEPLEPWRDRFFKQYNHLTGELEDPNDPITVAAAINDDVKSWFGFDERWYYHPTDQGLTEMLGGGLGRCEDMTNVTIYAMRANGLAVTSDYTPYWANSDNNHAWNAIVDADGAATPFMGAERNPGEYRLRKKMAKVYRKTFSVQTNNLSSVANKQNEVPPWLGRTSFIDVTEDYTPVCDVTVAFDKPIPDSVDVAYICVFNGGQWKAIHYGEIQNDAARFTDMGVGIVYLPALYLNEEIVPYGAPFILGEDCQIRMLDSEEMTMRPMRLVATTRSKQRESTEGMQESTLEPGTVYELRYWDNGEWQSVGEKEATAEPLEFQDVPDERLYWLLPKGSEGQKERIFTYRDGRQFWW